MEVQRKIHSRSSLSAAAELRIIFHFLLLAFRQTPARQKQWISQWRSKQFGEERRGTKHTPKNILFDLDSRRDSKLTMLQFEYNCGGGIERGSSVVALYGEMLGHDGRWMAMVARIQERSTGVGRSWRAGRAPRRKVRWWWLAVRMELTSHGVAR